ncbi:hypothetical protein [Maridesulfovibrio sp.]|uniref:hypothetical protein n=1 Tax=Maridesulfovibrio sp. TaxID=2795000 RepID=UPI002A18A165|nr:hypothetical protein [Maridesulfovibrio sp.]
MTVRVYVKCLVCDQIHVLRIGVGHSSQQEHTILCKECEEEMVIRLDLDQKNAVGDIVCVKNMERLNSDDFTPYDDKYPIINLHPELTFPPELEGQDMISPGLIAMMENMKKMKIPDDKLKNLSSEEHARLRDESRKLFVLDDEWKDLRGCWSQFKKGKFDKAQKIAEQKASKYIEEDPTARDWIFSFASRTLAPGRSNYFDGCCSVMKEVSEKYPEKFDDFLIFHNEKIFPQSLKKNFLVFDAFFKNYSDFSQCLWDHKRDTVTEGFSVSSCNFDEAKYFYGNTFEAVGSGLITFACLSNMHKGRSYNEFQFPGFDLDKYLDSDKSGRTKCFEDIPEFSAVFEKYNSSIRNGSHHATFELDPETMVISYQPRTHKKTKTMPYSEYVDNCVSIFLSCAVLTALDSFLNYLFQLKNS